MNESFKIEKAKVVKKGEYQSGNGDYGAWARINLRVEWEYTYNDAEGQPKQGKQSAVVTATGENAVTCRDNIGVGNEYDHMPYSYLNLTVRMEGKLEVKAKKDGSGTWEDVDNKLRIVEMRQVAP